MRIFLKGAGKGMKPTKKLPADKANFPNRETALWHTALPGLTRQLLEKRGQEHRREVLPHLAPDMMWIGSVAGQYTENAQDALTLLEREKNSPRQVKSSQYRVVYADSHSCIVVGWLKVNTTATGRLVMVNEYHVTVHYALIRGAPRVVHVHTSHCWEHREPGGLFPFGAGPETYRYVEWLLRSGKRSAQKIAVEDTERSVHVLAPDEMVFAEAQKPCCLLYTTSGLIRTREQLSSLERRLPGFFLRPHRSYLVNLDYVVKVSRFELLLCGGHRIPVPEHRYKDIKTMVKKHAFENV